VEPQNTYSVVRSLDLLDPSDDSVDGEAMETSVESVAFKKRRTSGKLTGIGGSPEERAGKQKM